MAVTTNQLWNLTKEFIHDSGLVRQHIDSYNEFVERGLQAIVDEVGDLPIEIGDYPLKIKLGKIEVGAPRVIEVDGTERSIYPAEARIRNLTYAAPLHMEMSPVIGEREGQPEMVYIGDLPVMLKSRICLLSKLSQEDLIGVGEDPLDPGGYFIVNGSERVIVALEDLAANRILVDVEHTGVNPTYKAKIFSTTVGFRARIEVTLKSDAGIYVTMPGIPSDIPLMILMRALGFEEDAKVAELEIQQSRTSWKGPSRNRSKQPTRETRCFIWETDSLLDRWTSIGYERRNQFSTETFFPTWEEFSPIEEKRDSF